MFYRLKAERKGKHVHVTFFSSKNPNLTFASSGTLIFREDEWKAAKHGFQTMADSAYIGGVSIEERFDDRSDEG